MFPHFIYLVLLQYWFPLLLFISYFNSMTEFKRLFLPHTSLYNIFYSMCHDTFFLVLQNILFIDWNSSNRYDRVRTWEKKENDRATKVSHVWFMYQMESRNQRMIPRRDQNVNCTNCGYRLEPYIYQDNTGKGCNVP